MEARGSASCLWTIVNVSASLHSPSTQQRMFHVKHPLLFASSFVRCCRVGEGGRIPGVWSGVGLRRLSP